MLIPYYKEYLNRVMGAVEAQGSLGRLSPWISRYTHLGGKPFSFRDHEWQKAIIDSPHHNVVVTKCSQVGLSEVMSRFAPAFLCTNPNSVAIFSQPTLKDAQRFAKSRFDPVIEESKYLQSVLVPGSDSSMFKRFGSSQLHLVGTFGKAVISIPTDLLVCDEIDFSSQEALTTAESRLTHSRFVDENTGERGIKRKFSTPTVPDYGSSGLFERSDQHYYMCKCAHCGHDFWPQFLEHSVVDGWDRPMDELTHIAARELEEKGLVDTGRLLCPKCHNVITRDHLRAEHRRWVCKFPERKVQQGFAVSPLDLPTYHYVPSLIRKMIAYGQETGHFRNFTLGLPYVDASNSIVREAVKKATTLQPVLPETAAASGFQGCVAGLDVGKTSWFLVGKQIENKLHVVYAEQIRLRSDTGEGLKERVLELMEAYGVYRLVADCRPYEDTILNIQAQRVPGCVLPCQYTLSDKKLQPYVIDEKKWEVNAHRTRTLNHTAKSVNFGRVLFPEFPEMRVVEKHLQGTKRVDRPDPETGDIDSNWVKTGDDHYAHALNYLLIAADSMEAQFCMGYAPPPTVTQAEVGKKHREREPFDADLYLLGL